MTGLVREGRQAVRSLMRAPGLTAAVVVTMALGIGAVAAIFAVVDGVVLRPLPFPDSERVVTLCSTHPEVAGYCVASPPDVRDWAERARTLEAVGLARGWSFQLEAGDGKRVLRTGVATPGFLEVVAARTQRGRLFSEADVEAGNDRLAVLSQEVFEELGGAAGSVGGTVTLDGEPFTVVGVLAADTRIPGFEDREVWVPLTAIQDDVEDRSWRGFLALGRLAPGATLAGARREMEALAGELAREHPETNEGWGVRLEPFRERIAGRVRPLLTAFLGAVGFVLLIACANVANLLLVRATRRRQELAVRASLGAGRLRLARLALGESVLLAVAGGILGLVLAATATEVLLALAPADLPRIDEVVVDGRVVAFVALLTLATAALFGLAPTLRAWRTDLREGLKGSALARGSGNALRGFLVVGELALALMLLAGAGLMIRSFGRLLEWQPGFERDHLTVTWLLAPYGQYPEGPQVNELLSRAAQEAAALPGVAAVGMTSAGPLFGGEETDELTVEGREPPSPEEALVARWYDVDPGYFETLRIPIVRGRGIAESDTVDTVPVAVVNQTLARRVFPGEDPVGKRVTLFDARMEIVGVVADTRPFRPDQPPMPEIFWPKSQHPRWATFLVLRTQGSPGALERPLRQALARLEPDLQVTSLRTMDDLVRRQLVSPRFNMLLLAVFAGVAAVLAAVGIYGVLSYAVASRRHEIGVRMALGAAPGTIRRQVLGRGMALAGLGAVLGLAGALALGHLMASLLFGLPATDPLALGAVVALFSAVALAACYLPARRASRLQPVRALRED